MTSQRQPTILRILVASTPKTGNTWLKLLLSEIYELPIVSLASSFDEARFEFSIDRRVAHQHYYPVPALLAWARANQVHLLTTVRDPADTLVSMVHYLRNLESPTTMANTAERLALDGEEFGPETLSFAERDFSTWLDISMCWRLARASIIVRYEDLWSQPAGTLIDLTSQICPVSIERIKRAIARCDLHNLRARAGTDTKFFRSGRVGEGQQVLPPAILDILRNNEPYVSQYAMLGYHADRQDGLSDSTSMERASNNPFRGRQTFDNGVPVPQLATELYTSVENCFERWPDPLATEGPDSFFAWINGRAEQDAGRRSPRLITNLAAYVYRIRPDVQIALPQPFRKDRNAFADWFVSYGAKEYGFPDAFVAPVQRPKPRKRTAAVRRSHSPKQRALRSGNKQVKKKHAKPI